MRDLRLDRDLDRLCDLDRDLLRDRDLDLLRERDDLRRRTGDRERERETGRRLRRGDLLRDRRRDDFLGVADRERDRRLDRCFLLAGDADLDLDSRARLDDLGFGVGERDRSLPDDDWAEGERATLISFFFGEGEWDLAGLGEDDRGRSLEEPSFFRREVLTSANRGDEEDTLLSCCGKNALSGKWPNNKNSVSVFGTRPNQAFQNTTGEGGGRVCILINITWHQ